MGHAFLFSADLLHKIGEHEMGQQQGGDQYGTEDGLCAIQGEIPGGADEGQQGGHHAIRMRSVKIAPILEILTVKEVQIRDLTLLITVRCLKASMRCGSIFA